jgi:hypothetical protein
MENGVGRFIFYAMTHIAISAEGVIGNVYREGIRQVSHACGSLNAIVQELESGHIHCQIDLDDIEQCTARQKILSALLYGERPDQLAITHLACRVITADVTRLLSMVDPVKYRYAVLTGILIHGPADTHWVYPERSYVRGADQMEVTLELSPGCRRESAD